MNFRSLPRPSSPPDSLGILRSLFSSFSRELQSLDAVTRHVQRLSSCLVFAYEIAVPNSQLEKNSRIIYKLQTDFLFYLYLLFSLNVVNELSRSHGCVRRIPKKTELLILELYLSRSFLPLHSNRELVSVLTPKRRCSSHTFRYGYLVTT